MEDPRAEETGPPLESPEVVPLTADLPLRKAILHVRDGDAYWSRTMGPVLRAYPQITVDGYWSLTVSEHAELYAHLREPSG